MLPWSQVLPNYRFRTWAALIPIILRRRAAMDWKNRNRRPRYRSERNGNRGTMSFILRTNRDPKPSRNCSKKCQKISDWLLVSITLRSSKHIDMFSSKHQWINCCLFINRSRLLVCFAAWDLGARANVCVARLHVFSCEYSRLVNVFVLEMEERIGYFEGEDRPSDTECHFDINGKRKVFHHIVCCAR